MDIGVKDVKGIGTALITNGVKCLLGVHHLMFKDDTPWWMIQVIVPVWEGL